MPKAKNESAIYAGTRGIFAPDPDLYGVLTVEPVFPGSCQAKRYGYRWVCLDSKGETFYIPFRDFKILSDTGPGLLTSGKAGVN